MAPIQSADTDLTPQAEHDRLAAFLPALGYEIMMLPNVPVGDRADFILQHLPKIA